MIKYTKHHSELDLEKEIADFMQLNRSKHRDHTEALGVKWREKILTVQKRQKGQLGRTAEQASWLPPTQKETGEERKWRESLKWEEWNAGD